MGFDPHRRFNNPRSARRYLRKHAAEVGKAYVRGQPLVAGDGRIVTDPTALGVLERLTVRYLRGGGRPVVEVLTADEALAFGMKPGDAARTFGPPAAELDMKPWAGVALDVAGHLAWASRYHPARLGQALIGMELAQLCATAAHPMLAGEVAGHA